MAVIVPLVEDELWQIRFTDVPELQLPRGPLLVIAPHPDDETLGAGALIAELRALGRSVAVVAVTDGENAYDASVADCIALGAVRAEEQQRALAALGVEPADIHRLRMTDSGLAAEERELTDRVLRLAEPGMIILAPWEGDFHPDHVVCARAAAAVAQARRLTLLSYFFWTWHRGWPELLDGLPLRRFDPSPEALSAKALALSMHVSQLERPDGQAILPYRLLAPARWPFEVFLAHE